MATEASEVVTDSVAPSGESFSKTYVEDMKAAMARQADELAILKASKTTDDNRKREALKDLHTDVQAWVKEGVDDPSMAPFKHEMGPINDFATGLPDAASIETALPLARLISCHSQKFKRKVEEFSQTSDTTDRLAAANKKLDEFAESDTTKSARISELESLADERLKACEDMREELAKHGGIKEKYDFSQLGKREVTNASIGSSSTGPAPARSAPVRPAIDPLLAFVGRSGGGGLKMGQSGTGHHFLGNVSGMSNDADISMAIRSSV